MKFLVDNWMLFVVAIGSGSMLLWPLIKGGALGGGGLSPSAAVQLINREKAVVVDVGESEEFAAGHVGGSKNVPVSEIEARLATVAKNKSLPLILVCGTGARAARVEAMAKKMGYEKAQTMTGGLKAWKEANLPLEKA
jgi:rhodanese-related sulfurtransferase